MYVNGVDDKNAREWIFILDAQRGVVAKAEARQVGLSVKAIRHRLRSGVEARAAGCLRHVHGATSARGAVVGRDPAGRTWRDA